MVRKLIILSNHILTFDKRCNFKFFGSGLFLFDYKVKNQVLNIGVAYNMFTYDLCQGRSAPRFAVEAKGIFLQYKTI